LSDRVASSWNFSVGPIIPAFRTGAFRRASSEKHPALRAAQSCVLRNCYVPLIRPIPATIPRHSFRDDWLLLFYRVF
jgi:hypothetical protein